MAKKATKTIASVEVLMQEWDWEKNTLDPNMIGAQSAQKAWWRCKYGHSWEARISNRYHGRGCPICKKKLRTSFPEQAIFYYTKLLYKDAINGYRDIFKQSMELDVFIPSLKIGIEYDGKAWHNNNSVQREEKKYRICKENGIYLIRIMENMLQQGATFDDKIYISDPQDRKILDETIFKLLSILGKKSGLLRAIDDCFINTQRDETIIYEQYRTELEKNSFANKYPEIAQEWCYDKNGHLTPKMFEAHSGKKIWWKCKRGHEWIAAISTRAAGRGCPYCSGNYVYRGYNDLATVSPEIAKEWNYERNGGLLPTDVTYGSGKRVWWKCEYGHEWMAPINTRVAQKHKCPYCAGEKAIVGLNDLCVKNPMLAKEWHPTKNGKRKPWEFKANSNIKVWWKCSKCGYEYQARICDRTKGTGCKNCSNQILHSGKNDLETLYPEIAKQWDYERNGKLLPSKIFPKTNIKVWWKCDKGHVWKTTPNSRTSGNNCPYCAGNKVWAGFNDLATTHPELAAEWNYERNGELTPQMVSIGSGKKVWWKCQKCGREYQSIIGNRKKGVGCKCSRKKTKKSNEQNNVPD